MAGHISNVDELGGLKSIYRGAVSQVLRQAFCRMSAEELVEYEKLCASVGFNPYDIIYEEMVPDNVEPGSIFNE